jgi:hypothetical protein
MTAGRPAAPPGLMTAQQVIEPARRQLQLAASGWLASAAEEIYADACPATSIDWRLTHPRDEAIACAGATRSLTAD